MAGQKRSGPFGSDDSSDEGGDAASSHSSTRKRRRTDREASMVSTSSSEHDDDASTPPSDTNEDEDDEAVQAATQEVQSKRAQDKEQKNEPAESGILEKIELKNFMCHADYTYVLGPLINFICGRNGSGKSAILTAIMLCLGGKAAATNRGSSLKNFIKEGTDNASIVCYVKNQGENAYMPEEYGESIRVERHFSRAGTSGFKLKSTQGRIISTKKADLEDICDHFMLQIENPLTILHQDQARQFISSSNSSDKYKYFLKGVMLEQLDQDYRLIEDSVDNSAPNIKTAKGDLEIYKRNWEVADAKVKDSRRNDSLRDRVFELRRTCLWAHVSDQEDILSKYQAEVAEAEAKIQNKRDHAAQLRRVFEQSTEMKNATDETYQNAKLEHEKATAEKKEEKARQDEAKEAMSHAQADLRQIKGIISSANATIDTKNREIAQEEARLAEIDGGGATRRVQELEDAHKAHDDAKKEYKDHSNGSSVLRNEAEAASKEEEDAKTAVAAKQSDIKQQEQQLRDIRKREGTEDRVYHPKMSQLLMAVSRETRFQEKPVGPVGKYVKLLRPQWSTILEKYFGSTLNSFVVSSKSDQTLLSDIMKKLGINNIPVNIATPRRLDTRSQEPDSSFLTVLRVLEIDNDLVRNVLVIMHSAENSILVESQDEATQILYPEDGPRPRNVARCFCFHPRDRTLGVMLHFRGNRPAQDPVERFIGQPRMRTNLEEQVRHQEDIIKSAKEQLLDLENEFRSCQTNHKEAREAIVRHKRRNHQLRIASEEAEDNIARLSEEIKEDNVKGGNLDALREALAEAQRTRDFNDTLYMEAQNDSDNKKNKLSEVTGRLNDMDRHISELQARATQLKSEVQDADKKRQFDLQELNNAEATIEDGVRDTKHIQDKVERQKKNIEEVTATAEVASARVNVPDGETSESLRSKYEKTNEKLRQANRQLGAKPEEIEAQALQARNAYDQAKAKVDSMTALEDHLKLSLGERKHRWELFRKLISTSARGTFTALLSERGFRGRLEMDHKRKLLDLKVEPDITQRSGAGRNAKTLSGGEKSFSQICLLLAIWDAMGSPIRCLDEFDVFMDAVNRTMSVNLLVEAARLSHGKQYILISPGTQSDIKPADDVKAITVRDPRPKGQTALTFEPATAS